MFSGAIGWTEIPSETAFNCSTAKAFMFLTRTVTAEIFFDRWRHEPAVYRPTRTRFSPQHRTGSRRGPEARAAPTAGENNSGIDLIWRCGIIFAVVVFWQDLYRRPAPGANFMSIGSRRLPRSLHRQQERVP